jgi:hypothetical protein
MDCIQCGLLVNKTIVLFAKAHLAPVKGALASEESDQLIAPLTRLAPASRCSHILIEASTFPTVGAKFENGP